LPQRFARILIQPLINAFQNPDAVHGAITADDRVEHNHALNPVMHQVLRVSGIDFADGFRRAEIGAARPCCIQLGKTDRPAAHRRREVRHAEPH
jgi:hypothetical protein